MDAVEKIQPQVHILEKVYPWLAVLVVLALYHIWQQSRRVTKLGNKMPGPPTLPLIGNAFDLIGNPHEVYKKAIEIAKDYNGVIRAWMGPKLIVALYNPVDVEVILSSHKHIDKSDEYRFFKPWLGDGLLISTGDKWRSHRKMIAPTFHISILKSFIPVFNRNSLHVVERLRTELGKTFDVHDYMSETTVDILLETAMGIKRKNHDSGFDYAMAVMKMCDIIHKRHYKLWLRSDSIFKWSNMATQQGKLLNIIHTLTSKVIKDKKEEYFQRKLEGEENQYAKITKHISNLEDSERNKNLENILGYNNGSFVRDDLDEDDGNDIGEKKRMAFLDYMIEASQQSETNLSDVEIKEEVDTIMFEGHDTTAAGSSFVLSLLGVHQDVQERVYREIHDIFKDSNRPATYADTLEMKYLERVIMESLRLYPPVPLIARKLNEDVQIVTGNYVVPAGTTVIIGTLLVHRHGDYYPNPHVFDPDNFLPERCQSRHYYSYIPFSAGLRSCVGRKYAMLKLKVLLSTILRNFKISSSITEEDFKLQGDIILKRAEGFKIKVEPRETTA